MAELKCPRCNSFKTETDTSFQPSSIVRFMLCRRCGLQWKHVDPQLLNPINNETAPAQ